ncbi:hypothetical protein GW17_00022701 [Ensete ventricosum]|nr:hypothetical protein GW17_00022701 [Ensete ventricosum]
MEGKVGDQEGTRPGKLVPRADDRGTSRCRARCRGGRNKRGALTTGQLRSGEAPMTVAQRRERWEKKLGKIKGL